MPIFTQSETKSLNTGHWISICVQSCHVWHVMLPIFPYFCLPWPFSWLPKKSYFLLSFENALKSHVYFGPPTFLPNVIKYAVFLKDPLWKLKVPHVLRIESWPSLVMNHYQDQRDADVVGGCVLQRGIHVAGQQLRGLPQLVSGPAWPPRLGRLYWSWSPLVRRGLGRRGLQRLSWH